LEKIKISLKELDKDSWGYDVQILDPSATVKDYLVALNAFQEEKVAPCLGCSGCCWERAPLTAPDIAMYEDILFDGEKTETPIRRFLEKYGIVYAEAGVVDIILRRDEEGACIFLDKRQHRCEHHTLRSLVCQTYICLPTSRRAADLRCQLVNAGENELIRRYYLEFGDQPPHIDEGGGPVDWAAYEGRGFKDQARFEDIMLRDVVDDALWRRLTKETVS